MVGSSNPPAARPVASRQPVEVLPEATAVQELVRQLHAVVYGYQLAIGKFKVLSKQRRKAERELLAHRVFRDRLIRLAEETLRGRPGCRAGVRPVGCPA